MENYDKIIQNKLELMNKKFNKLKTIAFVEGWSKRMLEAANKLAAKKLLKPLLVFETREQFKNINNNSAINHIIIEEETELSQFLINKYLEIRKGKEKSIDVIKKMQKAPLFTAMLLKTGKVDGAIGGVHNSTATILSNAFRAIGPKSNIKTISSIMLMHKGSDCLTFADVSVNPSPDKNQIVDIAINASDFVKTIGEKDKVAFLSFSSAGSAENDSTIKMAKATDNFNQRYKSYYKAIGEIQFDAAYDEKVHKRKYPKEGFNKRATIYIFPNLSAANIGYKIAQKMGGWGAIGPIITGLNQPFNDLSRGGTEDDVLNTAVITALQAYIEDKNDK